jgi:carbon monoxide dehydrogenase subunit G
MDMQASRELGVTQQQAWDALNDPEVLKLCIPGCDKVEATGENQYAIGMALKIGPVSAKFAGKINLSDIVPPQSYTISFEGQGGAAGFGKGNARVTLTPTTNGAAGCTLGYVVHASVGGKVAQLGQRLIDGAAKSMAEDFFKRFDQEMQKRFPPVAVPEATKSIADSASETKAGVQSASKSLPVWVWAVGAALLVALGMALSR